MPREIDSEDLQRLLRDGAQLVEVLPAEEYEEEHLPGAISIPLRRIDQEARQRLDPGRPVIVYCWDDPLDMSPRAAWRLESLRFGEVYDYVAGKQSWLAAGLPTEGRIAGRPTAGKVATEDVPTCRLDERLEDVAERVRGAGWDVCVVVNDERIVLGLLREPELGEDPQKRVEEVMRPGPSTFRPYVFIVEMAEYMSEHELSSAPITTGDGRLVGMLRREDAAKAALEWQREHEEEHLEHG